MARDCLVRWALDHDPLNVFRTIFGGNAQHLRNTPPLRRPSFRGICQVFEYVWELLGAANVLDELRDDRDKEGKKWVLNAWEAGNLCVFDKFGQSLEDKKHSTRGRGCAGLE